MRLYPHLFQPLIDAGKHVTLQNMLDHIKMRKPKLVQQPGNQQDTSMVQWIREFRPLGFRERLGMKMIIKYKVVCLVIMLVTFLSFSQTSQAQIAFVSDRDWNYEIYVMDSSGNDLRRLTNHLGKNESPSWSPNDKRIVFVSGRDGGERAEIYVVDSNGNNLRRLTNHLGKNESPSWSPDGRQIAFVSERNGRFNIYVMDSSGNNLRKLTNHPAYDRPPNWSPDGQRIAFQSLRGCLKTLS